MKPGISISADSAVTTIIIQRPYKQHVEAYENWLRAIVPVAQAATGHRGVNVIRPHGHSGEYTIVLHFDSETNLRNWLESDTRKQLVDKVRPFLNEDEQIDIRTGLEFWFTPPRSQPVAPPYKQFLITLSAIFPLSFLVPQLLAPVIDVVPLLAIPVVRAFLTSALIVALMTFVVMPRYVPLVARWLYKP
ncbi:Antibiotic biosynthesis monooxygenase [Fibrella aestuarina BUZ 2]|uniref:Antibiotic biosynthesis monooxygenase n=1 Tax=Fibrella aestuarina BUZ 2 TaxID=1166018 RepID=I0KBE6_9BACT|nr:antibiotic biosynthesis monooxygenase [Fibrella aestuarina]CCH01449.1 Antibiotic biosynthesis monooxygenase [Fibrella aestuarina BUZ 2]